VVAQARLTAREVRARRLARHGLTNTLDDPTPAGAAAAMHGAHAQVMSAAELSIALRLPDATRADVRTALTGDHSLTKAFGPRGTVHLLATRDLPMWTGALSAIPRGASAFTADVRINDEQTDQVVAAVAAALTGAELTLDELDEEVVSRTGSWAGDLVMPAFQTFWPRWRQVLSHAGHRGAVVFGDGRGRKLTYTSPSASTPGFASVPPEEALQGLLHGYLHAYGPATPAHLARWLSAPETWTRHVFDGAGATVEQVLVDGREAWVNAGDTAPEPSRRSVALLPYFDALSVGFAPRELMFPGKAADRALARGQAGNYPVLAVDGVVVGVWHHRRSGRRRHVTVETWVDLSPTVLRRLDEQVARVGEVLEADPTLTLGPVDVGPHA
jgi:hypothetical protein